VTMLTSGKRPSNYELSFRSAGFWREESAGRRHSQKQIPRFALDDNFISSRDDNFTKVTIPANLNRLEIGYVSAGLWF
jgi:hypothetical protein